MVRRDEVVRSEVRLTVASGLVIVRSTRPQEELESLLRQWGMLTPLVGYGAHGGVEALHLGRALSQKEA